MMIVCDECDGAPEPETFATPAQLRAAAELCESNRLKPTDKTSVWLRTVGYGLVAVRYFKHEDPSGYSTALLNGAGDVVHERKPGADA